MLYICVYLVERRQIFISLACCDDGREIIKKVEHFLFIYTYTFSYKYKL